MAKIEHDKYYTPDCLAEYCVNKAKEIIGEENITEYLEPSAGKGVFLNYLPENTLAYDLYPEGEGIIKQDYLTLELPYKKGRCIIGNPPFGDRNNLSRKFYKKSISLGDYIAFIQPVSQLNNVKSLFEFDLIYSENLGEIIFNLNNKIKCCFNIYKRPKDGLNKRKTNKLKDISIYREDYKGLVNGKSYEDMDYDLCIFRRGSSVGKVKKTNINTQTYKIVIHNDDLKYDVIEVLLNYNWLEHFEYCTAPAIYKEDIYELLKSKIPNIK